MGVPRFFIEILKKYKKTHFSSENFKFEYLFMDYNAFIYPSSREYLKTISYDKFQKMTVSKREQAIADFVVKKTIQYVKELNPSKLLYLAIDGPAPRGKMKLQRSRRYKALMRERYVEKLRKEFDIKDDISTLWSTNSLSPGTSQMEKISKGLKIAAKKKQFGNITVIIDDYSIPGEGEHKILQYIKMLETENSKDKLVVYSPDADMIILCLQYEGDIYNIRERDPKRKEDKELYPSDEVKNIIFSVNKYRSALKNEIAINKSDIDEFKLARDIMFITFFIGNDFVKAIYYTKSNKRGFRTILDLYKETFQELIKVGNQNEYLVFTNNNIPQINRNFFIKYLKKLSSIENSSMKIYYKGILFKMNKPIEKKSENSFELMKSNFEHEPYYSLNNPNSDQGVFKKINYNEPHKIWKKQYYSYFFKISPSNFGEYRNYINTVCNKYLESLEFCLRYYLSGKPPSWNWYYPFPVAPLPSDILPVYLKKLNSNTKFDQGSPYHPIEQLTMILPPQSVSILPKTIRDLIKKPNSALTPYYPIDFKLEKVSGEKFIYSYAILPQFVDSIVRPLIQSTFSTFTKSDKERNKLNTKYSIYELK